MCDTCASSCFCRARWGDDNHDDDDDDDDFDSYICKMKGGRCKMKNGRWKMKDERWIYG